MVASILINFAAGPAGGHVRRVTFDGRRYIVAPLSLIVPGVLPGSQGSLYYPRPEIARNYQQWERIPLTLYHPADPITNESVSAKDRNVLQRQGIGFVTRPTMNGKLSGLGYFDIEKLRSADQRYGTDVLNRLERGEKIELSTGLYTDNHPAENGATCPHTGRPYTHVARNYRADHVAVLPDQLGACSLDDGCGVNNSHFSSDAQRKAFFAKVLDDPEVSKHIPKDENGNSNPNAETHPHMAHLLHGSKVLSEGHTRSEAKGKASELRAKGVFASVFKDEKTGKHMVTVPANQPTSNLGDPQCPT